MQKIVEIIRMFRSRPKMDLDVGETRFFSHKTRKIVQTVQFLQVARNKKVTGVHKIDTDEDNFPNMYNPLLNDRNTEVCVLPLTVFDVDRFRGSLSPRDKIYCIPLTRRVALTTVRH